MPQISTSFVRPKKHWSKPINKLEESGNLFYFCPLSMHRKLYNYMEKRFTLSHSNILFAIVLFLLAVGSLQAQTTNNQTVVTKCYSGPTVSFNNTSGSLLPPVNFVQGVDIPAGHKVVDVFVEVVWSKTDGGSCTPPTGGVSDLSQIGFVFRGPTGGTRYLATSSATSNAPISGPTTNSFAGTFPGTSLGVVRDTTVFSDGFTPLVPNPGLPNFPTRDTVAPNGDPLDFYCGQDPYGTWAVGAIDDLPGAGSPSLCVHSYCITLVTCDFDTLVASCKVNPTVALSPAGVHTFEFADLDSISDVSCILKNVSFSPATVNCSNISAPVAVTMTLRDHLDSVASCVSLVTVADSTPPVIPYCSQPFGTIRSVLYLDQFGRDTFYADSIFMTDNCGPIIKQVRTLPPNSPWQQFVAFNCNTGFQQFWVRGIDGNGNVDSCRVIVELRDTFPPTAVCGTDTVYVGNGPVNLPSINMDAGSFDICPPITGRWLNVYLGPNLVYTCADLGIDTVSLIVSDASNNLDTCDNAIVTVLDTTAPTAVCQNPTVYLDVNGNGTLFPLAVDNGSVDSCGIDSLDLNGSFSLSYGCADVNTTPTVTLNVFDPSGNQSFCTATVTILDTFPPTAICRNAVVQLGANGIATLQADSLNNNSTDVCTGTNLTFTVNGNPTVDFDCADVATSPNAVTLTVTDAYGNSSTCQANVIVEDNTNPTANCANPTIYLDNAGFATVTAAQLSAGSSDNCGVVDSFVNVVGLNSTTFTCTAIFTPQPVDLIVRDASGNTDFCTATVTVEDTIRPTAVCRTSYTASLDQFGTVNVNPLDIDSISNDNCGIVEFLINNQPSQTYTCADIGSLGAVLTVRDSFGNTNTCQTTVIIEDNFLPTASCQATTVFLDQGGQVAITPNDLLAFPATQDNCGNITATFASGSTNIIYDCDSIGARLVDVIVRDPSLNQATCQAQVTVSDTTDPAASCRPVPFTVQLDNSGNGFVIPMNINNGSSDICGIDTMLVNNVDTFFFDCTNIGNTAVTLSVFDPSGNDGTCVAQIRVVDNIPPQPVCKDTTLTLDATGIAVAFPAYIDAGSSDNCSFTRTINNLPSITYTCNQVGLNTAPLVIRDAGGNTRTCSANITIVDNDPPVANCIAPGILNVFLDTTCFTSVPAIRFNDNSTDNCSNTLTYTVNGLSNATFTSANLSTNPNPVQLTVCDRSNNCDVCNTSVIVRDTIGPRMVCQPDTVQLDGNGNAVVVPNDINGGSSDNCSVPTYTINGNPVLNLDCTDLGLNQVGLDGIDQSNNMATCSTTVFVQDITPPNASCNNAVTIVLDPFTSNGTLSVLDVDNNSVDNCGITSYNLSRTNFNCADISNNPHTITMVVVDQSLNMDSCSIQVTVVDNVDPTASCRPTPLNLALVGSSVSITVADINNGSTDNCALQSLVLNQTTFTCNDIGSNTVILTATDSSGNANSCNATVNVVDNTNPVPFCNNLTVQLDANGQVAVAATDIANGSTDNCSLDTVLVNGFDSVRFDCNDIRNNIVNISMQDPSGNPANCTATITVEDNINPVANCVTTPVQLFLDPNGIAVLNPLDLDNNSTDNCSIVTYAASQDTFRCINALNNPNSVRLIVTDQSGNTDDCNASVTVTDTVAPNVVCQPATIFLSPGGIATVSAAIFDGGSSDACGIASRTFTGTPASVGCSDLGTYNVILTVTDVNGNSDTCNTVLTVRDTTPPTITCNSITVNLDAAGIASVDSATVGLYTANDACGITSLTLNGGTVVNYTCADTGQNSITLVVSDADNNQASCVATVTVVDNTPPTIVCTNTTQYLDANGNLTVDPASITGNIVEACGVDTVFTTPSTLDCSNVGQFNAVTLTVIDESGNQSTCNGNITVLDTIAPFMVCRDTTVCLNGGFANVTAADIDGGSVDSCGMSAIQTIDGTNNVIFTCADIGVQVVTLRRQDVNGNIGECQANVTVQDCTPPSAVCRTTYTVTVGVNSFVTIPAIDLDFGSFDDCRIDSTTFRVNGQPSITYNCNAVGTTDTVLFTVADFAGNLDSCTTIIAIEDNIDPVARCGGSITAVLSANDGTFVLPAFNLNNTSNPSSDNCTITTYLINGQVRDTFDCSMIGPNVAVLTVVDASGNTDTCQAIVDVQDITQPTATCQFSTTLTLDSTGQGILPASALILSASDNCGIASIQGNGQDTLVFGCSDIGTNQINVVVTDSSGNPFTCNAIVNVSDNIDPVAICPTTPVPAYLNTNSAVWVLANQLDSASFDNCGIADYLINGSDSVLYNCNQIGAFPSATLTVFDSTGNSDVCNVTIEVLDTISPVARCSSFTVTLSPAGIAIVSPSAIDSLSSDNCGNISLLINNQALDTFDCSNVSTTNTAILTVTDQFNNQSFCTANIDVVDVTPPTIQCPLTVRDFYLDGNGLVNVDPRDVAIASDTCSILNWFIDGLPDSTFNCSHANNTHVVVIRVEDPSGNFAQCNAVLRINDTIPPTNFCQNLTIALDSTGSAVVTGSDISLFNTDNCAIIDTLINGQSSVTYTCDSIPAAGDSIVAILTLIDASGNASSCESTITLLDNIGPVVTCNDTVRVNLNPQGVVFVQAISLASSSADACTPLNYRINGVSTETYNCSQVGNNLAILSVTDANGNVSTCPSIVQVSDETPPTAICQNIDIYLNSNGNGTIQAAAIDNGSFDNCSTVSFSFIGGATSIPVNCADTGILAVSLVVGDIYNNYDTCVAIVTIRDTTPPNMLCNGVTVDLTQTGQVTLAPTPYLPPGLGVGGASDNCVVDTMFVTPNTITCNDIGNVVFTLTAIDGSGNVATCQDTARVFLDRPTVLRPTQDTVLCEGADLDLSAVAPSNGFSYDYSWTGPNGTVTFNPTTSDTIITNLGANDEGYYVFTIWPAGNGCPASDSVFIDINEVQPPVLTGTQACDGDTAIIYLSNTNTYIGTNITYNWYFNGAPISNNADSLIIPNMTVADSGTYSMAITVDACNDSSVVGFTFDVLDLPASPVPSVNLPCEGQTLTLFNNAPGNTYSWSGPLGFASTADNPVRANANQAYAGVYTLTITDPNGCENTGSVTVAISPTPPQPELFYTQPLCDGDLLELQDTTLYNTPPVLYFWESPSGNIDTTTIGQLLLSNASAGEYRLTVSMNGCPSAVGDTQQVAYVPVPTGVADNFSILFRDSLTANTTGGNSIIINDLPNPNGYLLGIADSTDGGAVRLDPTNGTINYYPRSGFFGFDTLYYTLCDIQCTNSCDTVEVVIEVVADFECFIPQGISPNGDNINDEMVVRCKHQYPNAVLQIFSRWGTLVYEGDPVGWNGQFQGNDLPDGTYFYILKLNDTQYTGTGSNPDEGRVGDQYTGYIMLQR